MSAVGIADADALPASERPSPAVPNAVTAAALVARACFAACFTRGMVTPVSCCERADLTIASRPVPLKCELTHPVPLVRGFSPLSTGGRRAGWMLRQQR